MTSAARGTAEAIKGDRTPAEGGAAIGYFRKEFGACLLRSTWTLGAPGVDARGQERRPVIAILRRVWTVIPYLGDLWVPFARIIDSGTSTSWTSAAAPPS